MRFSSLPPKLIARAHVHLSSLIPLIEEYERNGEGWRAVLAVSYGHFAPRGGGGTAALNGGWPIIINDLINYLDEEIDEDITFEEEAFAGFKERMGDAELPITASTAGLTVRFLRHLQGYMVRLVNDHTVLKGTSFLCFDALTVEYGSLTKAEVADSLSKTDLVFDIYEGPFGEIVALKQRKGE